MDVEEFTPLVIAAEGDDVLTVVRFRVKARAPARAAAMDLHHRFTFRDGKIAYYRGTEDTLQTADVLARLIARSHVVGHRHDHDPGLEQQSRLHLQGPVVVESVRPPLRHELADHHRHQVGALGL